MVRWRLNTFGKAWEIQQWRDLWIDALCLPLDLRLKTEVCAIGLYHGVQLITVLLSTKTYHEASLTLRDEDYTPGHETLNMVVP